MRLLLACLVVLSLSVSAFATPPAAGPAADYLTAIVRSEPWAESVWKDYPAIPKSGFFGDGGSDGNGGIRGNCGTALAYAILVRELPNDPLLKHRLERVEAALRYAAMTHDSNPDKNVTCNDGHRWGYFDGAKKFDPHGWQSPLWAGSMGFAAALLEKDLDPEVVAACKRVVAAEATVMTNIPPASGYKEDTKSEENAWDAPISVLAASWMPNDPRAPEWLKTAKKYLVNTYTVPDFENDPLKEWVTTQTLFPSYGLENHRFYHPFYHVDGGNSMGEAWVMAKCINPSVAEEIKPFAEHNVLPVWNFVKGIMLDTGEMALPSGLDWSLHCFEHINYLTYLADHFHEPLAQWAEPRMAKAILARQQVNGDGRFVGDSTPNGFYREAVQERCLAFAYLHDQVEGFPTAEGTPLDEVNVHYPDMGIILHRSKTALVSVSYHHRFMALVYPLNGKTLGQQFIISPNTASAMGPGGPVMLKDYKKTDTGFRAVFAIAARGRHSTFVIESNGDGAAFLESADEGSTLPADWYLTAVENHPFTGGQRTLISDGSSDVIKERSGVTKELGANWLNVDDWLGIVAGPKGKFIYRAAKKYNREGAAEDSIVFHAENTTSRVALILPGRSAAGTAAAAKSLQTAGYSVEMPDGKKLEIQADK